MPTLLMLDTSLSMERKPEATPQDRNGSGSDSLLSLARHGLTVLLDHLEANLRLEQVALLCFGSRPEVLSGFSRDQSELRSRLSALRGAGATCFAPALHLALGMVSESWGAGPGGPKVNLLVVTDGGRGHGRDSLSAALEHVVPLQFRGTLTVVCLCHPDDDSAAASGARTAYEDLIARTGLPGEVLFPDSFPTRSSVEKVFQHLVQSQYRQYVGTLKFGDELTCKVTLCPPPEPYREVRDFEVVEARVSDTLEVLGFLPVSEASSPPVVSRHLVLPWTGAPQTDEDLRTPNLCVFLHGAMKVEGLCTLVRVAEDWFGMLFSCSDTKKKSSLMLSLFSAGGNGVPWLGDLRQLGPLAELSSGVTQQEAAFPVRTRPAAAAKPSYSSSPVVWIKQSALHSDVQKILRHARKLPDKTPHFYKELNRLKRNALCIGFHELLQGVAATFDRECTMLPGTSHPDCALQLTHAAAELRSSRATDLEYLIQPLGTKFQQQQQLPPPHR